MIKIFSFCLVMIPSVLMAQNGALDKNGSAKAVQVSVNRGKTVYLTYCLPCHKADGSGVPNLNPPLIKSKGVQGDKATLITMVLKGSSGKVEIDGETFKNTMPAQLHLSDQQIADVLTYVRNSFDNKADAVTPAEVKELRAKTK